MGSTMRRGKWESDTETKIQVRKQESEGRDKNETEQGVERDEARIQREPGNQKAEIARLREVKGEKLGK